MDYLYNGVRLPELPEWDKDAYPYAVILWNSLLRCYFLFITKVSSFIVEPTGGNIIIAPKEQHEGYSFRIKETESTWTPIGDTEVGEEPGADGDAYEENVNYGYDPEYLKWTNHDVYYSEELGGALYMAASDPIPVGAITPVGADLYVKKGNKVYKAQGKGGSGLPSVTEADNGKILRVVDGAWAVVDLPTYLGEYEEVE